MPRPVPLRQVDQMGTSTSFGTSPLRPPVPEAPARALTALEVVRRMRRNVLTTWPAAAYGEMVLRRRLFGADMLIVNDAALLRQVLNGHGSPYARPVLRPRGQAMKSQK